MVAPPRLLAGNQNYFFVVAYSPWSPSHRRWTLFPGNSSFPLCDHLPHLFEVVLYCLARRRWHTSRHGWAKVRISLYLVVIIVGLYNSLGISFCLVKLVRFDFVFHFCFVTFLICVYSLGLFCLDLNFIVWFHQFSFVSIM